LDKHFNYEREINDLKSKAKVYVQGSISLKEEIKELEKDIDTKD
jgi:hypothetical protein